jgi:hypothetical protein
LGRALLPLAYWISFDTDGIDQAKCPVLQSTGDDMFDSIENLFPGSEAGSAISFWERRRAGAAAVHSPHGIQEEDQKSPERDEIKGAFCELVVTGPMKTAVRTDRSRVLARP